MASVGTGQSLLLSVSRKAGLAVRDLHRMGCEVPELSLASLVRQGTGPAAVAQTPFGPNRHEAALLSARIQPHPGSWAQKGAGPLARSQTRGEETFRSIFTPGGRTLLLEFRAGGREI